jgi:hypothetical protein
MKSTRHQDSSLARHQSDHRVDPRLAERRLRVALQQVITRTPDPVHPWHDNSRAEPRAPLVCAKERELLHAAIAQGCTTPMQIVSYYLARLADSLNQFPEQLLASDVLYVRLMAEEAEALEAQALAHGIPTPANRETALRETREAIVVQQLECALLESGEFPRPMGVPRS